MLLDACVLYPAPLRDTLMSLAVAELFQARWTDKIHEEWIGNLLENRSDLTREHLERTRDRMNESIEDSIVSGYEGLIETLQLPDPADRHVLAAAIHAQAQIILTFNTKDFPSAVLSAYEIEICRPDTFVAGLFNQHPLDVVDALKMQRERLKKPLQPTDKFLETLSRQGLQRTVELLRPYTKLL